MTSKWRHAAMAAPGVGVSLLPKLACPACLPAYAGVLFSVGLGFLIGTAYLLPLTIAFLLLALVVMAFRARVRRGYRPLLVGLVASVYLERNSAAERIVFGVREQRSLPTELRSYGNTKEN
jgi:hypothetical protein